MSVSMEQVRALLTPIEPDYEAAADELGPAALPYLSQIATGDDLMLAPRAVYVAGLIGGDGAFRILQNAVESPQAVVRLQAAAGAQNLGGDWATRILEKTLDDADFGVRKVALNTTKSLFPSGRAPAVLEAKIAAMSRFDPDSPATG